MKTISLLSLILLLASFGSTESRGFEAFSALKSMGQQADPALNTQLKFHAFLEVDFFPGFGRRPTNGEIQQFEAKTVEWMTDTFAVNPTFVSFAMESVETAYIDQNPDFFFISFTGVVEVGPDQLLMHSMTMKDLGELVDAADYESFIRDYIRHAPPVGLNDFFDTHTVTLRGWAVDE